jgi:Mce-associated membrane protein
VAINAHSADTQLTGSKELAAESDAVHPTDDAAPDASAGAEESEATQSAVEGSTCIDPDSDEDGQADSATERAVTKKRRSSAIFSAITEAPLKSMIAAGVVICVMLASLAAWSSYRAFESRRDQQQRELFLQVGRQGAINLTTIDYHRAPDDVARILTSSTGTLYASFQQRAQPFVQLVQQVKAITKGTVTSAGLESVQDHEAQVLVAVKVDRWVNDAEQDPNQFRMRINVQKIGEDMKISNVDFVP